MTHGNPQERLALIEEIYRKAFDETESFTDGHVGRDLAYLFGAIAGGEGRVHWAVTDVIARSFEVWFTADHPVWQYIELAEA